MRALFLIAFFLFPSAIFSQSIFDGFSEVVNEWRMLQMYIPTLTSDNEKCRNHSLYYAEELKNMKLWATEMFDSSGKMPSGILYGSSHDLGNFDECIEIRVPYNGEEFHGQYCMPQFTIIPPKDVSIVHGSNYYDKNDYVRYHNESMWQKLMVYSEDKTKGPRNELYFAFCLPSSCTYKDLEKALEKNIELLNNKSDFKLIVDVNERSCQVGKPTKYSTGDIIFIIFLTITLAVVIFSSSYDVLTRKDPYKHLQLEGNMHDVLICFSFPSNFKKFISQGKNQDGLDCIAGMRVYSMFMIIVLHRLMFDFGSPMVNPKYVEKLYTKFETTILLSGPILVETFFTVSGFLATFLIIGELRRSTKSVNLGWFYFHRIVRMTPTYAVVLAFYCTIFIKLGEGPFWQHRVGVEQERCIASWWANLLYINNYVNTDKICMFQSWYVTCDMNFYLFAPVLAWVLWKRPKLGVALVISLIIASILIVFAIVYINNYEAMFMIYIKVLKDPVSHNAFRSTYIPGHMRASSYFVGILTGFLKHKYNDNNWKIPNKVVIIGWILSAIIMTATACSFFIFYLFEVPVHFAALYASLYHVGWSICISWMLIAISNGYGHWVDPVLRWRPLVVLSRLTYCVYICHGALQMYTAAIIRTPMYCGVFSAGYESAADILLVYILAFILSMMYESPIIGLEKVLLGKGKEPRQKPDENQIALEENTKV